MKASSMDDKQLIAAIMGEQQRAVDYANSALQENRTKAWDYYLNRPRGDEKPGRSQVQDTSVRDTVHALCATIIPTYDTNHLIDFPPMGQGDEDQADAEARAVNDILRSGDNISEIGRAIKDALLFRNGVMKVWHASEQDAVIRRFPDEQAAAALVALEEQFGADMVESLGSDNGLTSIRVTTEQQKVCVSAIEPAYFYVDPNLDKPTLNDARFISERWIATRSELVEMGIPQKLVDELPPIDDEGVSSGVGMSSTDVQAKFIDGQPSLGESATHDQERIECFWIHQQIDLDGDGISERWRFLASNYRLLKKEPVSFFPYVSGTGWEVPHRWSGLSVFDLLRITQNELTNARRQLHDNLNTANNQRPVADPRSVEWEDILAGAPGRAIRKKEGATIEWMPYSDIVSNSLAFIDQMRSVRSEQAGASLDQMSVDQQSLKSISGLSAEMQLGPSELMAADVSRTLANTMIKNLVLLIHRTLREQWQGPLTFRKSGEWQETNPAQWPARERVNITVALSPGERRRHSSHLRQVINDQMQLIAGGAANIATNYNGLHKALYDWQTSVGLDPTEGYFLDPDGQESQQAMQSAAESQQAQAQMQQQLTEIQIQLEQFKAQDESQKWQEAQKFDYVELQQKAEIEEAKLVEQGISARISAANSQSGNTTGGNGSAGGNGDNAE